MANLDVSQVKRELSALKKDAQARRRNFAPPSRHQTVTDLEAIRARRRR
jgi:hypothetical protein